MSERAMRYLERKELRGYTFAAMFYACMAGFTAFVLGVAVGESEPVGWMFVVVAFGFSMFVCFALNVWGTRRLLKYRSEATDSDASDLATFEAAITKRRAKLEAKLQ